jgi:fluoride exporter
MEVTVVILVVFFGGGVGSVCRYLLAGVVQTRSHSHFPVGTLVVNLVGCIAIGIVAKYFLHGQTQLLMRTGLIVGFCGGFTTFSAFSFEALGLLTGGKTIAALAYILASVALCLLGTVTGYALGPSLNR